MNKIKFKIITQEKTVYADEIEQVTIPTADGEITVLANHNPLVSVLKPGEMRLKKDGQIISLSVSSGFIEVRPHSQVIILADSAERAEDIDLERAEVARQRAEKMLEEKQNETDIDYARMQAILEKEMARLRVGKKYRKLK